MKYLNDEIMKSIKLKPCPFCKSEAKVTERYHTDEGYSIRVGCPKCKKNQIYKHNNQKIEAEI